MKILHTADLHLGRKLHGFSLFEEQKFMLDQLVKITKEKEISSVAISGDIYDKSVPSAEAISLFNEFLTILSTSNVSVYFISGNHDSNDRLSYGDILLQQANVYTTPVNKDNLTLSHHTGVKTAQGKEVVMHLLPFIKPLQVKHLNPDITTYTDAVQYALEQITLQPNTYNVLLSHQHVSGGELSESEELSINGFDVVQSSAYDGFDYVALGHLHIPQVLNERLVYSGSPMYYSKSEADNEKSVVIIDTDSETKEVLPIECLRGIVILKTTYEDLIYMVEEKEHSLIKDDFIYIELTDEQEVPFAMQKLREFFPRIVSLTYDNARTQRRQQVLKDDKAQLKSPFEIIGDLYYTQNNDTISQEQSKYLQDVLCQVGIQPEVALTDTTPTDVDSLF